MCHFYNRTENISDNIEEKYLNCQVITPECKYIITLSKYLLQKI